MISSNLLKRYYAGLVPGALLAGIGLSALVGWYASTATGLRAGLTIFALLGTITLVMTGLLAWALIWAEAALAEARETSERLRELLELSSDWYWEQDEQFRFTAMSGGVFNKGNFRIDDSLGKTRWELPLHEPDPETWRRHREQLARHESFRELRYAIKTADGSVRTYSVDGRPHFDTGGKFVGYRGVGHDITNAVQSEQALRASERRFALVMAATSDGIWDYDLLTNATYFSPGFATLLGYADTDSVRRDFHFSDALHPDDRHHCLERLEEILAVGGPFDETYRLRTATGAYRWYRGRGATVADGNGGVSRFIGALTDITEQKEAEEALRRSET